MELDTAGDKSQEETGKAVKGRRASRPDATMTELFAAALRILPEYSDKLDRLVQAVLNLWDQRQKPGIVGTKGIQAAVGHDLDPLLRIAMGQLVNEFAHLSFPLEEWIHKFSAAHEEGRLTDFQRLELRLRLTDLESKYLTARTVFAQLGTPIPVKMRLDAN